MSIGLANDELLSVRVSYDTNDFAKALRPAEYVEGSSVINAFVTIQNCAGVGQYCLQSIQVRKIL